MGSETHVRSRYLQGHSRIINVSHQVELLLGTQTKEKVCHTTTPQGQRQERSGWGHNAEATQVTLRLESHRGTRFVRKWLSPGFSSL